MNAIEKFEPAILEIEKFVLQLTPEIRSEAFRFLLEQQFAAAPPIRSRKDVASPETPDDSRGLSPQELLRKCCVNSLTDKAIVLGYWLETHQEKAAFSSGDLKKAFEAAREPSPKNPSDIVAKLEHAGKFMRCDKTEGIQQYRLTNTALVGVNKWLLDGEHKEENP